MRLAAKWRSTSLWEAGYESGQLDSIRIGAEQVEVFRIGRGEPLVILPGLAGGWRLVWPLARELARQHEVYLFGLRGDHDPWIGLEGAPRGPWDLGEYAQDVAHLIDRLGLASPTVFGVSFGGAIALELAVQHPQSLGSLIVNGAASRFRTTMGSAIARRVLERYPLPNNSPFVNQFFHLLYGRKPEPGPLVDFVVERIWETDQSVMARRLAQLESFDVSDNLWRIDAPTLVLAGDRDVIVPRARQQELAESIPGAHFETIAEAGHVGFLTHRTEVVRRVQRHLKRVRAVV